MKGLIADFTISIVSYCKLDLGHFQTGCATKLYTWTEQLTSSICELPLSNMMIALMPLYISGENKSKMP